MRRCLRCGNEMREDCQLKVEGSASRISLVSDKTRLFTGKLGRPNVAICPVCGEVSIYVPDVDLLR